MDRFVIMHWTGNEGCGKNRSPGEAAGKGNCQVTEAVHAAAALAGYGHAGITKPPLPVSQAHMEYLLYVVLVQMLKAGQDTASAGLFCHDRKVLLLNAHLGKGAGKPQGFEKEA